MYNKADQSYLYQPKFMSKKTTENLLLKIKKYYSENNLKHFSIVLHGGEPLLCGLDYFKEFFSLINTILVDVVLDVSIQTNGLLLNEEWLLFFYRNNVNIGISIDSTPQSHDHFRIDHKGKGSYKDVLQSIELIQNSQFHELLGGFLCVIDTQSSPNIVYQHFKSIKAKSVDFLLPDDIYDEIYFFNSKHHPPLGNWLCNLFDLWIKDEQRYKIRLFETIISLLADSDDGFDTVGKSYNKYFVVETNGDIEALDSLKSCGEKFTKTTFNINNHELGDAFHAPLIEMTYFAHYYLSHRCTVCPVADICGGGPLVTRYSEFNGFDNPSRYCYDLIKIISHIRNFILNHLHNDQFQIQSQIYDYEYLADEVDRIETTTQQTSSDNFLSTFARP
jgi:uncharacterized protein